VHSGAQGEERCGGRGTESQRKSTIPVFLHCIEVVLLSVMYLNSYTQTFKLANQGAILKLFPNPEVEQHHL